MLQTVGQYNKPLVAALAGAVVTIAAYYWQWPQEIQGAVTTILTVLGVWLVPNLEASDGRTE